MNPTITERHAEIVQMQKHFIANGYPFHPTISVSRFNTKPVAIQLMDTENGDEVKSAMDKITKQFEPHLLTLAITGHSENPHKHHLIVITVDREDHKLCYTAEIKPSGELVESDVISPNIMGKLVPEIKLR